MRLTIRGDKRSRLPKEIRTVGRRWGDEVLTDGVVEGVGMGTEVMVSVVPRINSDSDKESLGVGSGLVGVGMVVGVDDGEREGVIVGVLVGVGVLVAVGVMVGRGGRVEVGSGAIEGEGMGVSVGVLVGVLVGISVGTRVGVQSLVVR